MMDAYVPTLLADAQAIAIWEGTTNVCTMDITRAMKTQPQSFDILIEECRQLLEQAHKCLAQETPFSVQLREAHKKAQDALQDLVDFVEKHVKLSSQENLSVMRYFAFSLAKTYIATLLLQFACCYSKSSNADKMSAILWCNRPLFLYNEISSNETEMDRVLGLDLKNDGTPQVQGNTCKFTGKERAKL